MPDLSYSSEPQVAPSKARNASLFVFLLVVAAGLVRRLEFPRHADVDRRGRVRHPATEPAGREPPPVWIRALLIPACTGVSFAHGSNDGQKGMGLIMLILIGTVPTADALNRAVTPGRTQTFVAVAQQAAHALDGYTNGVAAPANPRGEVERFIGSRRSTPQTVPTLQALTTRIGDAVAASARSRTCRSAASTTCATTCTSRPGRSG